MQDNPREIARAYAKDFYRGFATSVVGNSAARISPSCVPPLSRPGRYPSIIYTPRIFAERKHVARVLRATAPAPPRRSAVILRRLGLAC